MTTQELRNKIEQVLGNNLRCLLPSYWWKHLFNQVANRIDEVDKKIDERGDGIHIVTSESALASLDLPKGSVASVTSAGMKFSQCYYPTEDELKDISSVWDKLTRVTNVEFKKGVLLEGEMAIQELYNKDQTQAIMLLVQKNNGAELFYAASVHDNKLFILSSAKQLQEFNELLSQNDFRYFPQVYRGQDLLIGFGEVVTINSTSDVYTKGASWEKLAKESDVLEEASSSSGGGSVMFVVNPIGDLTVEQKQENVDAYQKVIESEFAIDINIAVMLFIAKPNMVSVNDNGDLVLVAAGIDGGASKYIFTPEGDVTIETVEPTSSGGVEIRELRTNSNLSDEDKAYNIETVELYKEGKAIVITPITHSQTGTGRTDRMITPFFVDLHTGDSTKLATFRFLAQMIEETDPSEIGLIQVTIVIANDGSVSGTAGSFYDVAMSDTSTKAVQNKVIKKYIDDAIANVGGGSDIVVDTEISSTSTNPVQNKVVYSELQNKQNVISDLEEIRDGAALGATAIQKIKTINGKSLIGEGDVTISGGSTIEVDSDMSDSSTNPVQNKVVKAYVDSKIGDVSGITIDDVENYLTTNKYATQTWVSEQGYADAATVNATLARIEEKLDELSKVLNWFEFDDAANMIKAKYGIYSVGAITAASEG